MACCSTCDNAVMLADRRPVSRRQIRRRGAWILVLAAGIPAVTATTVSARAQVIASGLRSPRGLDVVDGRVYVAEAGRGGRACADLGGRRQCIGSSGGVTRVQVG